MERSAEQMDITIQTIWFVTTDLNEANVLLESLSRTQVADLCPLMCGFMAANTDSQS